MNENVRAALIDSLKLAAEEMEAAVAVNSGGSITLLVLCAVFGAILFVEIVFFAKRSWLLSFGCFLMLSSIPNLVRLLSAIGYTLDIAWVLVSSHLGFQSIVIYLRWNTARSSGSAKGQPQSGGNRPVDPTSR